MKTSIIEVLDMLSVLTVDEVEKRIRGVSGVESATVNHAAGNATVRYDETLLTVADIKVLVHQRGPQSTEASQPMDENADTPAHKHAVEAPQKVAPDSASPSEPDVPNAAQVPPSAAPKPPAPAGDEQQDEASPVTPPSPPAAAMKE